MRADPLVLGNRTQDASVWSGRDMTSPAPASGQWLAQRAPSTVAIFRALQVGDMLCCVPALRAFRAALPGAHISLIGLPWAAQFVERFGDYLDEFIAFPGHAAFPEQTPRFELMHDFYAAMRGRRFDLGIQLHGSGAQSNAVVRALAPRAMAGFGVPRQDAHEFLVPFPEQGTEPDRLLRLVRSITQQSCTAALEFPITDTDRRELVDSPIFTQLPSSPYICVHPGARHRDRCWHPARFAQVADCLAQEFGVHPVLTGSAAEADLTAAVARRLRSRATDAACGLSLGAMAALIGNASLIIANDTGVSHIAAALRVPSVIVFHGADMGRWAPADRQRHRCLQDPSGARTAEVLAHARALLSARRVLA